MSDWHVMAMAYRQHGIMKAAMKAYHRKQASMWAWAMDEGRTSERWREWWVDGRGRKWRQQ